MTGLISDIKENKFRESNSSSSPLTRARNVRFFHFFQDKITGPLCDSLFVRRLFYFFTTQSTALSDMFSANASGAKYNTFTRAPDNRRPSVEVIAARRSCILDLLASVSNK
jgi:hypothetical protein